MEQIILAFDFPKETFAAMMIIYKNTKVNGYSPDGDTDYFDIVKAVLQRDSLVPYCYIITEYFFLY